MSDTPKKPSRKSAKRTNKTGSDTSPAGLSTSDAPDAIAASESSTAQPFEEQASKKPEPSEPQAQAADSRSSVPPPDNRVENKASPFPAPSKLVRYAFMAGLALLCFFVFNLVTNFLFASSYVNEIANVFDMNKNLATAITIVVFGAMGYVFSAFFSFSGSKRRLGYLAILGFLALHSIILWKGTQQQFFSRKGEAIKCYIVTRQAIRYGERPGIDPATGLPCKPVTPEIAERLREYEGGRRPTEIAGANAVFFDPRTGAPVTWFGRDRNGRIVLFDLMGFHPETGQELLPVSPEIVADWRKQQEEHSKLANRRIPQRVDPERFGFFDPVSGAPRVWFWRKGEADYEFFDAPGFHPLSGEALVVISPDAISRWRTEADIVRKRRSEIEQQQKQALAVREAEAQRLRAEQERIRTEQTQAQREELEKQRVLAERDSQAGETCDRLAGNPTDQYRNTAISGVSYDMLRAQRDQAVEICSTAIQRFPNTLRYQYQLARATQVGNLRDALPMFQRLTQLRYPSAFDNYGWLQIRINQNFDEGIRSFRMGVQLGDADSMVSLSEMVERGRYEPRSPQESKWQLLARAASLGHQSAAVAVERERSRIQQESQQRQQGEAAARMMLDAFGGFMRNMPNK